MKLNRVRIKEFRSIKDQTIVVKDNCQIFIGINEAGKTNLLKALSLLDPEEEITPEDVRNSEESYSSVVASEVLFVFTFDSAERTTILSNVKSKILLPSEDAKIISRGKESYTFSDFANKRSFEGLYEKRQGSARYMAWALLHKEDYLLSSNIKKVQIPSHVISPTINLDGKDVLLSQFKLIDKSMIPENISEISTYLKEATVGDLDNLITSEIAELVEQKHPNVIFWRYSDENLIPSQIATNAFSANPNISRPLRNMFKIAGIEDISKTIETVKNTPAKMRTMLNSVASKTTTFFKKRWPDYRNTVFSLEPNGTNIDIHIKETSYQSMAARSDGFKRFITFLLLISAEVHTLEIKDSVIIIDEPEISLHPTGAGYLLKELVDISKSNIVFFSTHSVFMIDKTNIQRHLIVKKDKEITVIENPSECAIDEEEVLRNALNFSFFSGLKDKNIIFEGWRDFHLFQVYLSTLSTKDALKQVGACYSKGVRILKEFTALFQLTNKKCLIISDADDEANSKKREHEEDHGYGTWKTYADLGLSNIVTSEDFIKDSCILRASTQIKAQFPAIRGDFAISQDSPDGIIRQLDVWLTSFGQSKETRRSILNQFKSIVFDELTGKDIDMEKYKIFIDKLSEEV